MPHNKKKDSRPRSANRRARSEVSSVADHAGAWQLSRRKFLSLVAVSATLAACGRGGGFGSRSSSETPPSDYDVAAVVANLRADPAIGGFLIADHAAFPEADGGLALPEAPVGPFTTYNVSTLADASTYMQGTGNRVILAPGNYSGSISFGAGSHNILEIAGCTITPADGNLTSLTLTGVFGGNQCHHILIDGGNTAVCNTGFDIWHADHHATDVHIRGVDFQGGHTSSQTGNYDGENGTVKCHRFLLERSRVHAARGGLFVHTGSTNVLAMNSILHCPKIPTATQENPFRAVGSHLCLTIDCNLISEVGPGENLPIKYTWRSHSAGSSAALPGGRNGMIRCQVQGAGMMATYAGTTSATDDPQSTQLVFVDNDIYQTLAESASLGPLNIPYINQFATPPEYAAWFGDVMNEAMHATGNRYFNDSGSPGADWVTDANLPPGTKANNVYVAHATPPAWAYRTMTP